jgi:ABC-2 type transport system permease protein
MFNLLEIEFYKLKKSKAFYILILLSVAQSLVVWIFNDKLIHHSGKETLSYMLYIQSSLGGNLFVGILSADFIGNEFTSGYIKNLICYGHRRRDVLIAKSIVYFLGSIIINFTCPVIFTLINTMKNGYYSNFTFWEFINLLAIILTSIVIQIAICSISLLVIFLSKSPNINIGILIGVDFIFRAMSIVSIHVLSFRNIYDNFILSQFGIISQDNVTISQYLHAFAIGVITIAIFFSITNYFFEKSDI